MNISKFQTILLVFFGASAVAAVFIFAFAVGGTAGGSLGRVTIWGTLDAFTVNAMLRQASESNASLSSVTYEQKDPLTYEQDITNALASGTGPDVFIMRQDYAVKNAPKISPISFANFSEETFRTAFIEAANPFISKGLEGILAVPFAVDPLVLYWNRDLLATAGYSKPPTYWDEVVPMSTYIGGASQTVNKNSITVRDQSNLVKKSSVSFGEYQNVTNAKDVLALLIMQAGGAITAFDTSSRLIPALGTRTAGGGASQAAESALRFYTGFADPSKNDYSWNRALPESRTAFAAGDLGLYVGYASEEALLKRMNPNLNFGSAVIPQIRGSEFSQTYAHVYGFAISRASRNPTGAFTVAYLLASANMSRTLASALGIPSARRDVLATKIEGDNDVFLRSAIISKSWIDPDPDRTTPIFRGMIENTTSGTASVSEAISRGDQELAQILGL